VRKKVWVCTHEKCVIISVSGELKGGRGAAQTSNPTPARLYNNTDTAGTNKQRYDTREMGGWGD
jgi:hypothetical protein